MRPYYENISTRQGDQAFVAYRLEVPAFEFKWHYHSEYELTLILRGAGKRLVGDSHQSFKAGDLVLVGPSVPHTWVSDPLETECVAIVVQFPESFILPFLGIAEFSRVAKMIMMSRRGLFFPSADDPGMESLPGLPGAERVIALIAILERLSNQSPEILVSHDFIPVTGGENETRINKVCRFVLRNIDRKIALSEVAGLIYLSDTAFAKFFKRATGKTFSDYVNEVRISRVCSLLTGTDRPIGEIAYSCGFENMAYFNRVFLRKKRINPKAFRDGFFGANASKSPK